MNQLALISQTLIEISPFIIAVASLLVLIEISIAKRAIKISSKREAVSLAAEQCKIFAEELIPLSLEEFVKNSGIYKFKKWKLKDNNFTYKSIDDTDDIESWVEGIKQSNKLIKCLDFINKLELFSMYFSNGVADEQIAFPAVAAVYCEWVNNFTPLLIHLRENNLISITSGPYQNVTNLYKVWSKRITRRKIEEKVSVLAERYEAVKSEEKISVIGTE